jgi:tetratricopeptide (TPR) repeat protein
MTADTPTDSKPDEDGAGSPGAAATTRSWRRALLVGGVGAGVIALVIAAVAILNRDSSASTAQAAGAALSADELSQLDSLLTELPDDLPTSLERGRALMAAGDYDNAMDQYLAVLDEGPNAEALAFIGWITFDSGDPDLAQHLLEQSLVVDPDYLTATWFLANVKYYGTQDVAAALPLLQQVIERADAEPDMVQAAEEMLALADEAQPAEPPPAATQP